MTLFNRSESLLKIGAEVLQLSLIQFFNLLPLPSELLLQPLDVINPRRTLQQLLLQFCTETVTGQYREPSEHFSWGTDVTHLPALVCLFSCSPAVTRGLWSPALNRTLSHLSLTEDAQPCEHNSIQCKLSQTFAFQLCVRCEVPLVSDLSLFVLALRHAPVALVTPLCGTRPAPQPHLNRHWYVWLYYSYFISINCQSNGWGFHLWNTKTTCSINVNTHEQQHLCQSGLDRVPSLNSWRRLLF